MNAKPFRLLILTLIFVLASIFIGCAESDINTVLPSTSSEYSPEILSVYTEETLPEENYIQEGGTCLQERIILPDGYTRTESSDDSFASFIRNYPLLPDGSDVLLYDGTPKGTQNQHVAVFDMPVIADADVQQCADSVMRMYAEYFLASNQPEKIKFHFVNGFLCDYITYRDGNRIQVNGNDVSWTRSASYDDSYETFEKYLHVTFAYSSTISMEKESSAIELNNIQVGDIFLKAGSPGHVMLVVDVCENKAGQKAFLLAQGFMPAQQFHVVKNPLHESDPWYYADEITYPLQTPSYTFDEGSLRRTEYLTQ